MFDVFWALTPARQGMQTVKREALIRLLRREARGLGLSFFVETSEGKGSHYRIYLGGAVTVIQSGELSPQKIRTIRKQLHLPD